MSPTDPTITPGPPTAAEWELRVELAAAFRLADQFGWTELVWNHITARVPEEPEHFLINPLGLRWDEISASKLIKVGLDGEVITGEGIAPKAGFVIHSAVHEARPDVNACMHTHTTDGIALSALTDGLQPVCHEALYFYDNVGYHSDEGAAMDVDVRTRLSEDLGNHGALILRNHGLLTVGISVGEAFTMMYWLQRACEIQMKIMASQAPWQAIAADVCARFAKQKSEPRDQAEEFHPGVWEWPALMRQLDERDRSYRN
jgi:ribulose-5-phosphate 4-epimerase/fuculose-1-phosphate aldolase